MKTKSTILTNEERNILILSALHQHDRSPTNIMIGQYLGMSAINVNTAIHKICIKLGAHDRNEAILLALRGGEIKLTEFWSPDELGELLISLGPNMLRRVAKIVNQGLENKHLLDKNKQAMLTNRRKDDVLKNRIGTYSSQMKMKSTVLTKDERDVLISATLHPNGKFLSNTEIGQRLGISSNRVNRLIHQACIKLGAHSKGKAINLALKQGDIILTDLYSLDELAEIFCSLGPIMLRRIANIVRQGLEHGRLPRNYKHIIIGRRRDSILTNRERDVVILAGLGLINREIADRLYMSRSSVRTFLNRACTKLGVRKRSEAMTLALKQRDISINDVYSLKMIINYLAPLGAESIDKMAELLEQKLGQELPLSETYIC